MTVSATTQSPSRWESFKEEWKSFKKERKATLEALNKTFNDGTKGVKNGADIVKNSFKLKAEFGKLSEASKQGLKSAETVAAVIGVLGLFGTANYFASYDVKLKKAETTQQQAGAMALIGVCGVLGTLKLLEEFTVETLSKITATIGNVPVVKTLVPGLSVGLGVLLLAHEWVTWKRQAIDDKINELSAKILAEKEEALKEFETHKRPTFVEHQWTVLGNAGNEHNKKLSELLAEQQTLYTKEQWEFRTKSIHDDPWSKLFQRTFAEEIVLVPKTEEVNKQNASVQTTNATTDKHTIIDKCLVLREGIAYEKHKCGIAQKNSDLNKTRSYIRIAQTIMEIAAGALLLIGLFGGVAFLAAGPFGIALAVVVAAIGLYQFYDARRTPEKSVDATLKKEAWDLLARWKIQGAPKDSTPETEVVPALARTASTYIARQGSTAVLPNVFGFN